jgi:hypothetical protein
MEERHDGAGKSRREQAERMKVKNRFKYAIYNFER